MHIRHGLLILGTLLCLMTQHAWAQSEPRLALLIGNSAYRSSPLANPVNDVRLRESALKETGFTVIKAENASIREMRRLVRDFGDKLKASGGVGLFYFAGHGVQVRGENYLVSTDSDIRNEDEVADDSINASVILEKMQGAGNRMNLIVLDACRNNPFAVKSRSAASGLATMSAPSGSLVAYATAPGSVASDGSGNNGLYTQHLAKVIRQPGLPVEEVFKQVRAAVRRASNNQQTPWENTALEGQFYFKAPPVQAEALPAPVAARPPSNEPATLELMLWESAKSATTLGELQAYLNRYPNGFFADMAKARMAALGGVANDKAAAERIANERAESQRAAAERDAQAARLKTANEFATAQASRKDAEERAAAGAKLQTAAERAATEAKLKSASDRVANEEAQAAQQSAAALALAVDQWSWEKIRFSQNRTELEAYLMQFPDGSFSAVARSRLAQLGAAPATLAPGPVQAAAPKAGDVIGTMVLTDTLTGIKSELEVTVLEADAQKIMYSTGDVIGRDGKVLQVRVGEVVLELLSGSLWTVPIKAGASGEATVRTGIAAGSQKGELQWKTLDAGNGKIRVDSTVQYRVTNSNGITNLGSGNWLASYVSGQPIPESFSTNIRGGAAANAIFNLFTAELKFH